jgi:hypothetical protein
MIDLWRALLPVIEALEAVGVDYAIGGSVASSFTGVARATQDADLAVDLQLGDVRRFLEALGPSFYADRDRAEQAIRSRRSFNVIHLETMYKVDLFIPPDSPFTRSSFARRVQLEVAGIERRVFVTSPEDIVLHKLVWYAEGNRISDRQWYDLSGVLRIQRDHLDRAYLERWADSLGVADLLRRALVEAEPA